jgi:hypothetical protein
MKTYTQAWDTDRVVERATGSRHEKGSDFRHGPSPPLFDDWAPDYQHDFFVDDMKNTLFYRQGRDGQEIEYQIERGDSEVVQRVVEAVAVRDQFNQRPGSVPLSRAVREWIGESWSDVARHGRAIHEVAPIRNLNETRDRDASYGVAIIRIDPKSVGPRWGWLGGGLVQWTSSIDQREHGLNRMIRLKNDRFAIFRLPGAMEGQVQEAVNALRGKDVGGVGFSVAPWSRPDLYELGYKLDDHSAIRDAVIARGTRETGWIARGQFEKRITSHYLVRRQIREGRFATALESALLAHLNSVLANQANQIGANVTIRAKNAFTLQDHDEAERLLDEGSRSFREIMGRVGL